MNHKIPLTSRVSNRLSALAILVFVAGCIANPRLESEIPSKEGKGHSTVEAERRSESGLAAEAPVQTESSEFTISLKIVVTGFEKSEGVCRIAVFQGQDHFNDIEYAIAKELVDINESKAVWQINLPFRLKAGQDPQRLPALAISAYHDENKNSRLDKSSFGIPIERYGFSKNPKRGFGPPKFSEVAIQLKPETASLMLEVPILIK